MASSSKLTKAAGQASNKAAGGKAAVISVSRAGTPAVAPKRGKAAAPKATDVPADVPAPAPLGDPAVQKARIKQALSRSGHTGALGARESRAPAVPAAVLSAAAPTPADSPSPPPDEGNAPRLARIKTAAKRTNRPLATTAPAPAKPAPPPAAMPAEVSPGAQAEVDIAPVMPALAIEPVAAAADATSVAATAEVSPGAPAEVDIAPVVPAVAIEPVAAAADATSVTATADAAPAPAAEVAWAPQLAPVMPPAPAREAASDEASVLGPPAAAPQPPPIPPRLRKEPVRDTAATSSDCKPGQEIPPPAQPEATVASPSVAEVAFPDWPASAAPDARLEAGCVPFAADLPLEAELAAQPATVMPKATMFGRLFTGLRRWVAPRA